MRFWRLGRRLPGGAFLAGRLFLFGLGLFFGNSILFRIRFGGFAGFFLGLFGAAAAGGFLLGLFLGLDRFFLAVVRGILFGCLFFGLPVRIGRLGRFARGPFAAAALWFVFRPGFLAARGGFGCFYIPFRGRSFGTGFCLFVLFVFFARFISVFFCRGTVLLGFLVVPAPSAATTTATAAFLGLGLVAVFGRRVGRIGFDHGFVHILHQRGPAGNHRRIGLFHHPAGGFELLDRKIRADQEGIRLDPDRHAIAGLDLGDMFAFVVHQVVDDTHRCFQQYLARTAAGALLFQLAQDHQGKVFVRTDQTGAVTMRTGLCRGLDHAGAQALAAHLHQAETGNPAHLNTGAIIFQRLFQPFFHRVVVAAFVHVDVIDHDQTGQIAQAQLAGNLVRGFKVGFAGGFLDAALAGGAARVHVDRHQRFGHADHDIAAGFQLNRRIEHAGQIGFDLIPRKQRQAFLVMFHILGVGRHDHFHEILGRAIAFFAFHQNFVNLAVIQVADRTFDQVAFLVNLGRRDGFQRQFANLLPQALQIFVIALDLGLGALGPGGADNQTSPVWHVDFIGNRLQLLAVCRIGDLAGNTAATGGVRHQHAIAACQRKIGGQRRALVAALFFHHLHQQYLAHLDHFLNLVTARTGLARRAQFLGGIVISNRFDTVILFRCLQRGVVVIFCRGIRFGGLCPLLFCLFGVVGNFFSCLGGLDRCFTHQFHGRRSFQRIFGQVNHIHPGYAVVFNLDVFCLDRIFGFCLFGFAAGFAAAAFGFGFFILFRH